MTIKDTIKQLDELRELISKAEYQETADEFRYEFERALVNAYEDLRRAALAGAVLAEEIKETAACRNPDEIIYAALAAYHKACGG